LSDPDELFEDDLNGLDDESDELPKLAWVVELLKHPGAKQTVMLTIKPNTMRVIMTCLRSMVFFSFAVRGRRLSRTVGSLQDLHR
jgi:hypothetical protein